MPSQGIKPWESLSFSYVFGLEIETKRQVFKQLGFFS
jgi:hypothetical protein